MKSALGAPGIPLCAQRNQPLRLGGMVRGVKVEMNPAPPALPFGAAPLQRNVRSATLRIGEHHPASVEEWIARHITARALPEGEHFVECETVDDNRTDLHA